MSSESNYANFGQGSSGNAAAQGQGNNATGGQTSITQQIAPLDQHLLKLEEQVQEMLKHLQGPDAAKAKAGLDAVKLEAKASKEEREKDRKWYSVSTEGLREAALAVAKIVPELGKGVLATLGLIESLKQS